MCSLRPVLLIENDEETTRFICCHLLTRGYEVESTDSGEEGLALAMNPNRYYDLIILEIMLPDRSGFEIIEEIRDRDELISIMVISRLGAIKDVVQGFECGADDYLRKPFDKREMAARVDALVRRLQYLTTKGASNGPAGATPLRG